MVQACQVDMPGWWGELVAIPNAGDPERLAHKIHVLSFKIPQVRIARPLGALNSYTAQPLSQNASKGRCSCWSPTPIYLVGITISSNL